MLFFILFLRRLQEYIKEVERKGSYMLESPITGGLDALRKGQMVAYVGGRKDVVDAVMPILEVRL